MQQQNKSTLQGILSPTMQYTQLPELLFYNVMNEPHYPISSIFFDDSIDWNDKNMTQYETFLHIQ